jgi:hypothetical protein
MIDAIWLLGSRTTLDYTKAATTWLLTRKHHDDDMEETMKTATTDTKPTTTARKIGHAIAGFVFALFIGPLFVIGAYTILASLMSL